VQNAKKQQMLDLEAEKEFETHIWSFDRIAEAEAATERLAQCPRCKGKGKNGFFRRKCELCEGKGKITKEVECQVEHAKKAWKQLQNNRQNNMLKRKQLQNNNRHGNNYKIIDKITGKITYQEKLLYEKCEKDFGWTPQTTWSLVGDYFSFQERTLTMRYHFGTYSRYRRLMSVMAVPSCPEAPQSTISIESNGLGAGLILVSVMILFWIFASRTRNTQKHVSRCSLSEAELIV